MEKRRADFCEIEWQRMLDATSLEVVLEAKAIVSEPPETVETITGFFRLPRALIAQATAFAQENAEACLRSRQDVAAMPVADPWEARRQAALEERVRRVLERLARLAEHHWPMTGRATEISRYVAEGELLRELAASWEDGQRDFHRALRAGDGGQSRSPTAALKENGSTTGKKQRRRRGDTTEERLANLLASDGGWGKVLACRKAEEVGKLIKRSHAAVVGTRAWKEKIRPRLSALKDMAKYHRLEQEERRRDRHQTD